MRDLSDWFDEKALLGNFLNPLSREFGSCINTRRTCMRECWLRPLWSRGTMGMLSTPTLPPLLAQVPFLGSWGFHICLVGMNGTGRQRAGLHTTAIFRSARTAVTDSAPAVP